MRKKRPTGTCHLCGSRGLLSFEHVPPESAFNNQPVVESAIEEAFGRELDSQPRGKINQRGAGSYTLCDRCNNVTGSWYADAFARWCGQGAEVLVRSEFRPKLIYLHYVLPLRVLKQIITMCFSTNTAQWRKNHPELETFVLDRNRRWLDPKYRVFAYYNVEGTFRRASHSMALVNLNRGRGVIQVTEISHPPFGYVLTVDGSKPDERLCEITHFQRYEYGEFEVAPLYLPVLPTHLPIPLDYRTQNEINEQIKRSRQYEDSAGSPTP